MKRKILVFAAGFISVVCQTALAQQKPSDEPQDTRMAISEPDKYAWRLFIALNWPANQTKKIADSTKKLGADLPVVWESWRNARNQAADTVFPLDGSDPGEWLSKGPAAVKSTSEFDALPEQLALRKKILEAMAFPQPAFDPTAAEQQINETRLNKDTYEFIRSKSLYNVEGQEALFANGVDSIEFPANSKEVKAQWRPISSDDKARYHWVEVTDATGQKKLYGLTALHILTKDIPRWFWTTFEHIDNRLPASQGGKKWSEGWLLKSHDAFACSKAPYDCEEAPKGIGLEGTPWANYRLRGTQLDFTDARGAPTHLANSQPEQGFQPTSSCVTCHSRATIGPRVGIPPNRLTIFNGNDSYFGTPDPIWFRSAKGELEYVQLDFVWSLFRARRVKN